jgi:hypothetical protein
VRFTGNSTTLRKSQKARIRALIAQVPKGGTVTSVQVHAVVPKKASKSVAKRAKTRSDKVAAYLRSRGMPNVTTVIVPLKKATSAQMRVFGISLSYTK